MLVSGGKILAIDQVYTDNNTILGDGVQKPLFVNTKVIATNATVLSVSSKLEQQIDYVSGHLPAVTAGKNVGVAVSTTPDGRPLYIVSADDVEQREVHIIGDNGVSAAFNDATSSWNIGVSAQYLSANALDNYYNKTQVDNKLSATSSWADNTFQEKGNYVYAFDFNQFKEDVNAELEKKQNVSAMSAYAQSAWVNDNYQKKGNYVSATDFDEYKEQVSQEFTNTSSWANETFLEKGEYVSATEFNEYKEQVETEFENTSAWANETFQPIGEYLSASEKFLSANALDDVSGKWESVYNTTVTASGNWNEASAFGTVSGKFVTSADVTFDEGKAYVLAKDEEENVSWSGVDLSDLGKMYPISSLTPDLISATISAVNGTSAYVLSAAKPSEVAVPSISGENGVSAHYNAEEDTYVIGLSGSPAYASFTATTTADDGVYTPATYSESYNVGNGVTLEDNTISVGPGLWHVTIYAKVTNTEISPDYYDTMLTCNNIKNIVQFDNSYIHTEYINLDADIVSNDSLAINVVLENVPANSTVVIEQLQLHRIVTGNVVNEGGNIYTPGNGISIDNYQIDFNAGDGLTVNSATNTVNVQAGSGIFIDANNKLSIKLGKGLAFSADGDVVAIETNTEVNEVVETVENLKQELDGKLTTNMNISDAKNAGCPWDGDTINTNNIAASFFTIPLQHNLTTASEISFFTTQGLGQNDSDPLILGILEYNFDFFESVPVSPDAPNGVSARSQTQWIADTGPIWVDTPDVNGNYLTGGAGRYTYRLKNVTPVSASDVVGQDGTVYHNEFGPSLRSDRAYYLALYTYSPNSYNNFLCDDGYATGINNTDPAISFRKTGTTYTDTDGVERTIDRSLLASIKSQNLPFSISGMQYWSRATNSVNQMKRPYVMIRNPRL